RSHVGWRLLYTRARELGKEVLVISSDRQIRSVVKAAGFKVAESLESTPTGKARLGSRSGRYGRDKSGPYGGKPRPHLRTSSSDTLKGTPKGQDQSAPDMADRRPTARPRTPPAPPSESSTTTAEGI